MRLCLFETEKEIDKQKKRQNGVLKRKKYANIYFIPLQLGFVVVLVNIRRNMLCALSKIKNGFNVLFLYISFCVP